MTDSNAPTIGELLARARTGLSKGQNPMVGAALDDLEAELEDPKARIGFLVYTTRGEQRVWATTWEFDPMLGVDFKIGDSLVAAFPASTLVGFQSIDSARPESSSTP